MSRKVLFSGVFHAFWGCGINLCTTQYTRCSLSMLTGF